MGDVVEVKADGQPQFLLVHSFLLSVKALTCFYINYYIILIDLFLSTIDRKRLSEKSKNCSKKAAEKISAAIFQNSKIDR